MGYDVGVKAAALALASLALGCGGRSTPAPAATPDPLSAPALMADVEALVAADMGGRGSYQAGARRAADYVAAELAAAGLRVLRQDLRGGAENVIAIKRGGPRAIIVSAHHDHLGVDADGTVYPGADDNASGVAALLGIARSRAAADYEHTVLFVSFGAEEDGLVGSGHYVHHPLWPLARTAAVINFDMIGRPFFQAGADREATCAVVGLEADPELAEVARRAAAEVGLSLIMAPARLLELFAFEDRTDDWWFRRQHIPAFHFSTGLHDDYHEPTDTRDRLVPAQIERVARTAAALLDHLAERQR